MISPNLAVAGNDGKHLCPAIGCTNRIRAGLLLCPKHWAQVRPNLQTELKRAWNAVGHARSPEVFQHYKELRARVIESVNGGVR